MTQATDCGILQNTFEHEANQRRGKGAKLWKNLFPVSNAASVVSLILRLTLNKVISTVGEPKTGKIL